MPHSTSTSSTIFGLPWRGLTLQLFLFVILPLSVLLIVIPLGSLVLHGNAMRELVSERDERAVRAASATIAEQLNHRAATIQGLALHTAMAGSPETVLADYAFLLPDFEGGLALYASDGTWLAASPSSVYWPVQIRFDSATQTALGPELQFSPVISDSVSGVLLMRVAAVAPNGQVAIGAFSPANLVNRALGDISPMEGLPFTFVVDEQGQVLFQAGRPPVEEELAQHPGVAEALRGESGGMHRLVGNSEHVIAYSPVTPIGWALVIEEPWEAVDNPLLRLTQAAPLILIPLSLFALIAIGFGIRQIVQPLRALEQKTSELAWGRFEAIETPVGGIAEIRHLQSELVQMTQKLKAAQQNLRSYLSAITAGQEDERRRIARELHDGAVQALVALDQRAQLAQMTMREAAPNDSPLPGAVLKATEQLAEVRRMTAALMEEVRRVIRALRPIYLEDLGLLPALEMLARDLEIASGAQVTFETTGPARRLPSGHEIALYRIVQEALNNAARYASARSVNILVAFNATELIVRVQDDGQGFTAPERVSDLVTSGHYGLMGMQERAELIGAHLAMRSAPGTGTTIEVQLPLG